MWRANFVLVARLSKRITLSFKRESRCDEVKLAAPEAKVQMGVKVEVLLATRSMQGGNANVVSIELRVVKATWSMPSDAYANVIGVQIQGGHGLRRAVGQELCHGGRSRAITFSTSTTRATKSTQIVAANR